MNTKTGITFSIATIAAVTTLSGPLVANQQVQAFPFGNFVQNVDSFELQPIIQGGVLQAVCVQNIMSAQQIVTNPNTISG
ncbi:MAG: hypothetical protein WBZ36_16235 [Candidatus Nitrosopolaris sp.]